MQYDKLGYQGRQPSEVDTFDAEAQSRSDAQARLLAM